MIPMIDSTTRVWTIMVITRLLEIWLKYALLGVVRIVQSYPSQPCYNFIMYISMLKVATILSPQCSSIPPLYHLIKQTDPSQPSKLMILGTTCSVSSIIMGEIAQRSLNLTQVRLCIVTFFLFLPLSCYDIDQTAKYYS